MFQLDFAARVDRGVVREMNQDVAWVVPRLGLALVADGMGGHDHGEIASCTAAEACKQSFARLGGPGMNAEEAAELLEKSFREANERIAQHPSSGERGRARMGTTLVAAVFAHGHAIIANVGDSRCYRLHEGSFEVHVMQQQQIALARRQRAELQLTQVRTALARLGSGAYGACLRCGQSIGYARLRVRPETTLCRDCQSGGEE